MYNAGILQVTIEPMKNNNPSLQRVLLFRSVEDLLSCLLLSFLFLKGEKETG